MPEKNLHRSLLPVFFLLIFDIVCMNTREGKGNVLKALVVVLYGLLIMDSQTIQLSTET